MKTCIRTIHLMLGCFLLPTTSHAQHHALLRSDASWQVGYWESATICGWVTAGEYFVFQDTVIAGTIYKQLGGRAILSTIGTPYCPPYYLSSVSNPTPLFLREDTVAGLVFSYDASDGLERTLYDYNLEVGDTIDHYFDQMSPAPTIVIGVDTVLLYNGEARRKWTLMTFDTDGMPHDFVEGVGSSSGIFHPFANFFGDGQRLRCYRREGAGALWGEAGCIQSGPLSAEQTSNRKEPFLSVLPDGHLTLSAAMPMLVVIHSVDGRLITKKRVSPGPFFPDNHIERGVLTYTLVGTGGQFVTGKLVYME